MEPTDAYDYSPETLLRPKAAEVAKLRDLLVAVAGDLERMACEHPDLANAGRDISPICSARSRRSSIFRSRNSCGTAESNVDGSI